MRVKVLLDSGVEKNQKLIGVISSTLSPIKRRVVFELHGRFLDSMQSPAAITCSLFWLRKNSFWKAMLKRQEFINAFARLGTNVNSNADDIELLEKFRCFLYISKVYDPRSKCFWKVYERKGRVIDLSLMPPCAANLHLHISQDLLM